MARHQENDAQKIMAVAGTGSRTTRTTRSATWVPLYLFTQGQEMVRQQRHFKFRSLCHYFQSVSLAPCLPLLSASLLRKLSIDAGLDGNSWDPDSPCRPTCLKPFCGDRIVDPKRGEECDAGAPPTPVERRSAAACVPRVLCFCFDSFPFKC